MGGARFTEGCVVVSFLGHSLGMRLLVGGARLAKFTFGYNIVSMVEHIHVRTQPPPLYRREAGPYP